MATQTPLDVVAEVRAVAGRYKLTQAQIADILHVSRMAIVRRMNGSVPFATAELIALADHVGIPVATFFGERAA